MGPVVAAELRGPAVGERLVHTSPTATLAAGEAGRTGATVLDVAWGDAGIGVTGLPGVVMFDKHAEVRGGEMSSLKTRIGK